MGVDAWTGQAVGGADRTFAGIDAALSLIPGGTLASKGVGGFARFGRGVLAVEATFAVAQGTYYGTQSFSEGHWGSAVLNFGSAYLNARGMGANKSTHDATNGVDIALGLSVVGNKPGALRSFADKLGAKTWTEWANAGLTHGKPGHFGSQFSSAAKKARRIFFNLEGIGDINEAIRKGAKGFGQGNMTNAELFHIITNPELINKTTFFKGGNEIQSIIN